MSKILILGLVVVFLAGCATMATYPPKGPEARVRGVYHEVRRGETLWRISRTYGVGPEEIAKTNRLPDATKIMVGQLIFIPGASKAAKTREVKTKRHSETFIWPVRGKVVSYFGSTKNLVKNKGIDIEARSGRDVVSSRSGRVTFCDDKVKGYGKTIIIDHGDGFQTVYAHNSEILTGVGDNVGQNEVIARVGTTGMVKRPTLHFEIRKNNKARNPFYYLP